MEDSINENIVPSMQSNAITISDGDGTPVLVIDINGTMQWRPQGSTELIEMNVEKDVALAFALCVEMLSGMPYKTLMNTTRKNAVDDKAGAIAEGVAQYLIDINLAAEEHRDIHTKNVKLIIDGL